MKDVGNVYAKNLALSQCVMFTTKDVMNIFGCSENTIIDLRDMGILKGTKIGRGYKYSQKEILALQDDSIGYDLSNSLEMRKFVDAMKVKRS